MGSWVDSEIFYWENIVEIVLEVFEGWVSILMCRLGGWVKFGYGLVYWWIGGNEIYRVLLKDKVRYIENFESVFERKFIGIG